MSLFPLDVKFHQGRHLPTSSTLYNCASLGTWLRIDSQRQSITCMNEDGIYK